MSSEVFLMSTEKGECGRRCKTALSHSTHKQTSDKQKVAIVNVEAK